MFRSNAVLSNRVISFLSPVIPLPPLSLGYWEIVKLSQHVLPLHPCRHVGNIPYQTWRAQLGFLCACATCNADFHVTLHVWVEQVWLQRACWRRRGPELPREYPRHQHGCGDPVWSAASAARTHTNPQLWVKVGQCKALLCRLTTFQHPSVKDPLQAAPQRRTDI